MQLNKRGKNSIMQNDSMQTELSMQITFIDFTFIELKGGYNKL